MARFGDIKWKSVSVLLSAAIVIGATAGCTNDFISSIRPEINRFNGMVTLPDAFKDGITHLGEDTGETTNPQPTSGINSPTDENSGESGGTPVGDATRFDPLPYNAMAAPDYIKYLDLKVYQPLCDILNKLEPAKLQKLYFRVFHSGYDVVADDTTAIQPASIYDNKMIGLGTHLYGITFPSLACDWLGNNIVSPDNNSRIKKYRESVLSSVNRENISPTTTWLAASAASAFASKPAILKMWGNERLKNDTLQEYLSDVRSEIVGVIPNVTLRMASTSLWETGVTINNTSDLGGSRYVDHLSKADVDRLFKSYNQLEQRQEVVIDLLYADEYGVLFAYIDGYSKTIVALCCFDGATLDDTLGDTQDEVMSIITGTYDYTQWAEIAPFVPNATILQAGVKGMS